MNPYNQVAIKRYNELQKIISTFADQGEKSALSAIVLDEDEAISLSLDKLKFLQSWLDSLLKKYNQLSNNSIDLQTAKDILKKSDKDEIPFKTFDEEIGFSNLLNMLESSSFDWTQIRKAQDEDFIEYNDEKIIKNTAKLFLNEQINKKLNADEAFKKEKINLNKIKDTLDGLSFLNEVDLNLEKHLIKIQDSVAGYKEFLNFTRYTEKLAQSSIWSLYENDDLYVLISSIDTKLKSISKKIEDMCTQELNEYEVKRKEKYGFKDFFSNTDAENRSNFINNLKLRLIDYVHTADEKKKTELVDFIRDERKKFPGFHLQSILNRLLGEIDQDQSFEEQIITEDEEPALTSAVDESNALYQAIERLENYGNTLENEDERQRVAHLVNEIKGKTKKFILKHNQQPFDEEQFLKFQLRFESLIHSQDDLLSKHNTFGRLAKQILKAFFTLGIALGIAKHRDKHLGLFFSSEGIEDVTAIEDAGNKLFAKRISP